MVTASFTHLEELPDGELRSLLDLLDRLRTEAGADRPVIAGFFQTCWAALYAERQRRWDALVARSHQMGRRSEIASYRVPWVRRSPAA